MTPRCGKPMRRFEAVWGPLLEPPACGRPAGHNGRCRSPMALERMRAANTARIAAARRAGRYTRWWAGEASRAA